MSTESSWLCRPIFSLRLSLPGQMYLCVFRGALPGKERIKTCEDMATMYMSRIHKEEWPQHIRPHECDKQSKYAVKLIHSWMPEMPILTPIYSDWLVLLFVTRENYSLFRNVSWKAGEWYQCTWYLDGLRCSSDDLWGKAMILLFHSGCWMM